MALEDTTEPRDDHKMDEDDERDDDRRRGDDEEEEEVKPAVSDTIDREKTCPLLLRVFWRHGGHNSIEDYRGTRVPPEELQIYTWLDASLKELSNLIKEVNVSARRKGAKLAFATVYRDNRGSPAFRHVGEIVNGEESEAANTTLKNVRFRIGDYIDVAIFGQKRALPVAGRLDDTRGADRRKSFGVSDEKRQERVERFGGREDREQQRDDERPRRTDDRPRRDEDKPRRDEDRPRRDDKERKDRRDERDERDTAPPSGMHPERARQLGTRK